MSYKYIVIYSARTADDEGLHGRHEIETEKKLETQEELQEVARVIAERGEFVEAAINMFIEVREVG